jgi:hypothetical protein
MNPERAKKWVADTAGLPDPPFTAILDGEMVTVTAAPDVPFEERARLVYGEALTLLQDRHKKYGPQNIGRAPGGPMNGLRVRMHDKLARINHAIDTYSDLARAPEWGGDEADFVDEKFRDALLDLANYALIGVLVVDGKWPQ